MLRACSNKGIGVMLLVASIVVYILLIAVTTEIHSSRSCYASVVALQKVRILPEQSPECTLCMGALWVYLTTESITVVVAMLPCMKAYPFGLQNVSLGSLAPKGSPRFP